MRGLRISQSYISDSSEIFSYRLFLFLSLTVAVVTARAESFNAGNVDPETGNATFTLPCATAPTTYDGSRCGPGSVRVSTNIPPSGYLPRWYDAAMTYITMTDDQNFDTPYLTTTTTFYVSFYNFTTHCETAKRPVTATINPPLNVSAGADQTGASTCGLTTVTLSAYPSTGSWSVVSGSGGSFSNPASSSSFFSGTVGVSYTLRWSAGSGNCTGYDDVNVTFNQNPSMPNAGPDQTGASTCGLTRVDLSATAPSLGTGTWINGDCTQGGVISRPGDPVSPFSGVAGALYCVTWRVTYGACSLSDETYVKFNQQPTPASAGQDQTDAATCGLTSVPLAGNTPVVGTGNWNVVSGVGGSFSDVASPASSFNGTPGNTYTLRWTIANSPCPSSTDDVIIKFNRYPSVAIAGPDMLGSVTCGLTSVTLGATPATVGTGNWTVVSGSGGSFGNTSASGSTFSGTIGTPYSLRWTVSNAPCAASYDDALVTLNAIPNAAVSLAEQTICSGSTAAINITNPNNVAGTDFTISAKTANLDAPAFISPGNVVSGAYSNADGLNSGTATYTITPYSSACTGSSVTATVTVNNTPEEANPPSPLVYNGYPATFQIIAPDGTTTQWYLAENSVTPFATGDSWQNASPNDPLTYYVSFKNQSNTCESPKVPISAIQVGTINPAAIVTEDVRVSGLTSGGSVEALNSVTEKAVSVSYVDGLSRISQIIKAKASPLQQDVIQPMEYDSYGRASKSYLPYTKSNTSGFQSDYAADQLAFYQAVGDKVANDAAPFTTALYEASSLGRPLEQGNVGQAWQPGSNHTNRASYSYNTGATNDEAEEVRKFLSDGSSTGFYPANQLSRIESVDEQGNKQIAFVNGSGNIIARKQQLEETIDGAIVNYLQTYYIYDEFGRLGYIIPPKETVALKASGWSFTSTFKDNYTHQFTYDNRGRLVQKKVPGQAALYYCYDNLNRLVLMQDGNTRPLNKWMFIKYDQQGRAIMQGLYLNSTELTRTAMQTVVDGLYRPGNSTYPENAYYELRGTALHGYTNRSFPTTSLEVTGVNYFDSYDFDYNGTDDVSYTAQDLTNEGTPTTRTEGLATGSKRVVIGTTTWLYDYIYYDKYGRPLQLQSNNHLNPAVDNVMTNAYDFDGKVIATKQLQRAGGGHETEITQRYEYDHAGRLKSVYGPSSAVEPVQWGALVGTTASNNTATKAGMTAAWDAGAFSTNGLAANQNGWIEFKAGEENTEKMIGFSTQNADVNYTTINYALYMTGAGDLYVFENGVSRGLKGTYTANDFLSVGRKNGIIYYKKNNAIIYESAITNLTALYADCSLYTPGASLRNVSFFRPVEVIVASYEYNELGQLVDRKLFSTDNGATYQQSVDYRYTIQGQVESINNARLEADDTNNDPDSDHGDYFGMEFLYNLAESTLDNTPRFDGNISAIKWKSSGAADAGLQDQRSYAYTYDKAGRLETSRSKMHDGAGWLKDVGIYNEAFTYDHNGNILSLQRNQNLRGLDVINGVPTVTNTLRQMDSLTYTYSSSMPDQLLKVEDAAANDNGFNNGSSGTANDYTYDSYGNVTKDSNKGISSITYNFLGKPDEILFTDGRKIVYSYDGAGNKIAVKNYEGGTLKLTTDYLPGSVYENGVLSFMSSPEGRIVMNGTKFEYQYAIADNQGNTRVLFTSETPAPESPTATFEGDASDNADEFLSVDSNNVVPFLSANHTTDGIGVIRMNQNYKTGPAKSLKVFPGDVVDLEVWAYFEGSSGFGTTSAAITTLVTSVAGVFGGSPTPGDPGNAVYNGVDAAYGAFGAAPNLGDSQPSAYLNYIMFDKEFNVLDMGWKPVPATANFSRQRVFFDPIQIKEAGFIYTYLSYEGESDQYVYFDDFKVTHTKTSVLQYSDYYAFGLSTENSWARDNGNNNFLYNEGSELNKTSGFYDLPFRNYDAALGRFFQVDPMAAADHSISPFSYANNNPVLFNDPTGLVVDYSHSWENPDWVYAQEQAAINAEIAAANAHLWSGGRPRGGSSATTSSFGSTGSNYGGYTTTDPAEIAAILNAAIDGTLYIEEDYFSIPTYEVVNVIGNEVRFRDTGHSTWVKLAPAGGSDHSSAGQAQQGVDTGGGGNNDTGPWDSLVPVGIIFGAGVDGYIGGGVTVAAGGVIITRGPDKGKVVYFLDHGVGLGLDLSAVAQLGAVFYTGDADNFTKASLIGERVSISGALGLFGVNGFITPVDAANGRVIGILGTYGPGINPLNFFGIAVPATGNINYGRTDIFNK